MTGMEPSSPVESALPPTTARILAVAAIVFAGVCGGLIGWKIVDLQVDDAGALAGLGGLVGAIGFAAGVGVVASLVLRAMAEWNTIIEHDDPAAARRDRDRPR